MKIVLINQARMTSTRLPGKVLKTVLGKPLLEFQIERIARVKNIDAQIVATTINVSDDPIVELCNKLGVEVFRGSEPDVLSRYYYAALPYKPDAVVRVTSDCPLIDPQVIEEVVDFYIQHSNEYLFVSNVEKRTYPRGMDVEVFSFAALEKAYHEAKLESEREHVTPYIQKMAPKGSVIFKEDFSKYRLTVDTPEDFQLIQKILVELIPSKPQFSLEDILHLIKQNPEWAEMNAHISQKE